MVTQLVGQHIPRGLSGPVLVDRHGLPRYWAAVWWAAVTGALAESTHLKKLRYIDNLYQHGDELRGYGALDDALGTLNDSDLAEILESWFISIRNQATTSEADETRWQVGFGFVTSVVSWIAKSDAHKALRDVEARLHQLSVLYSQFHVNKRNTPEMIRSLPASTVEVLYQILDPESKDNPFSRVQTSIRKIQVQLGRLSGVKWSEEVLTMKIRERMRLLSPAYDSMAVNDRMQLRNLSAVAESICAKTTVTETISLGRHRASITDPWVVAKVLEVVRQVMPGRHSLN